MKTELYVKAQRANDYEPYWFRLDLGKDSKVTLQYVSNILSDVSKITTSHSMTLKLPRTARNDEVLDLAVVPQYESQARYKYLPCQVCVNGIDVTGDAHLYLTDSEGESYSCVVVFGLMQSFRSWLDGGKTLMDLQEGGQYIRWEMDAAYSYDYMIAGQVVHVPARWYGSDANLNTYTPANGLGKLMYFGVYDPGFDRSYDTVQHANVHPFVTVREVWERIVSENGLDFVLPNWVNLDMEDLAMVLTKRSGNDPQGNSVVDNSTASSGSHPDTLRLSSALSFGWNIVCDTVGELYANPPATGTVKGKVRYKGDANAIDLQVLLELADSTSFQYNGASHTASYILNAVGHLEYFDLCVKVLSINEVIRLTPTYSNNTLSWSGSIHIPCINPSEGDYVAEIWIDNDIKMTNYLPGAFDTYWMLGRGNWDNLFSWTQCALSVIYYEGSHAYPHPAFRCFKNMPDITQVDFVKFVSQLYGLFPVLDKSNNRVEFVPFDSLVENIYKAYDWSGRLLEKAKDAPERVSFRLEDFAQRNLVSWKEDDKDPVIEEIRTGELRVNDLTLDKMKEMVVFPFAASEGNTINQYSVIKTSDEELHEVWEVDFTECKPRILRVVQWEEKQETNILLDFQNLQPSQILGQYYEAYQAAILEPRLITERVRLNEVEIRDVDFRIPVYLGKYGRYYAIKNIKWTTGDSFAEVELLQIQ